MTETPADNGADGITQPLPQPLPLPDQQPAPVPAAVEAAPRTNHTRTILEVVGAVVAVGAIFFAGVGGFVLGHFSGRHANDDRQLSLSVDGRGHDQRDGQQGQSLPSMPGQQGNGPQGNGPQGNGQQGPGGMMIGPEDLQRFLQGLGGMLGQQGNGQQGNGPQGNGQQGPGGMTLGPEDLQQFLQGLGGMMDQQGQGGLVPPGGTLTVPATPVPAPSAPQQ